MTSDLTDDDAGGAGGQSGADDKSDAGGGSVAPPGESPGLAPSNPGFVAASLAAAVAFVGVAPGSWLAAAVAGGGALALAAGALRGSRAVVRAGSVGLAAAVVLAGLEGAAPLVTGLSALAAVVAWDAVTHALAVTAQVGAAADDGVVLAHVRGGTLVGAGGLGVAAVAFLAGTGASALAAGVAVVAAIALVLALALD
jgi:hypothetical protein